MKKLIFVLSLVFVLMFTSITAFAAELPLIVSLDSTSIEFTDETGKPFVDENNRTQVPFRVVLEKFGADVAWDNDNRIAIATKDNITVQVPIDADYILKNDEKIVNDTTSRIVGEKTYLPIRKVMEAFGCDVQWDNNLRTVVITTVPVDAKAILTEANNKSYDWKNYDAKILMNMSMPMMMPDDSGNFNQIDMKMDMNMDMTIFTDPMKIKISADMMNNALGLEIPQHIMDMYMTLDDKGYTTYMGINDGTATTWIKQTVEDESFGEYLSNLEANKELFDKYIKTVNYLGKYPDENENTLLKLQYTISGDIYNEILGDDYLELMPVPATEEEQLTIDMIKNLFSNMADITCIVYVNENTQEIVKYEMDLSSMIISLFDSMASLGIPQEELELLKGIKVNLTMDVLNINTASDFEIPEEALNALEASELLVPEETEETTIPEE